MNGVNGMPAATDRSCTRPKFLMGLNEFNTPLLVVLDEPPRIK